MFEKLIDAVKGFLLQSQSPRRENTLREVCRELTEICADECRNCEKRGKIQLVLVAECSSCDDRLELRAQD